MKRILSACLEQTLHFRLKDAMPHDAAARMVREEYTRYREQLDRNRTQYRILSENAEQMHLMASVLLERETVDGEACEALLDNRWEEYLAQEAQRIQAQAEAEAAVAGDAAADGIPAAEAGQADAATLADASPQVPAGKYCHACGAGIAADAVYCNHCGAKQED